MNLSITTGLSTTRSMTTGLEITRGQVCVRHVVSTTGVTIGLSNLLSSTTGREIWRSIVTGAEIVVKPALWQSGQALALRAKPLAPIASMAPAAKIWVTRLIMSNLLGWEYLAVWFSDTPMTPNHRLRSLIEFSSKSAA